MYPASVPDSVVHALYQTAAQLSDRWAGPALSLDLDSRVIQAVLDSLESHPPEPASRLSLERCAVARLRLFWKRSARRDYARHARAVDIGKRPHLISLDLLLEEGGAEPATDLYAPLSYDCRCGEVGRQVADLLISLGEEPVRAWAFVWRASDRDWADITILARDQFGLSLSEAGWRRWALRHFNRLLRLVRQHWADGSGGPVS